MLAQVPGHRAPWAWHLAESPQSTSRRQCRRLPNASQTSARTRNVGKTVCRKAYKGRMPKIKDKGILPDGRRDFLGITASSWRQEMQTSSTNDANQADIQIPPELGVHTCPAGQCVSPDISLPCYTSNFQLQAMLSCI